MQTELEFDGVPESEIPAFAHDGKQGDRVSFVEGGVLHVRDGRASFVRYGDVLGVVEHHGQLHVLVPRRAPAPPWLVVDRQMLGADVPALRRFSDRLAGGGARGYRDAVRRSRQGLSPSALQAKVAAREPVAGAMEVPSTVVMGRSYPGLGLVQAGIVVGGMMLGYAAGIAVVAWIALRQSSLVVPVFAEFPIMLLASIGLIVSAMLARSVGRRWRAKKDATLPRQRVLVLAPDGCVVGFSDGVKTLAWSEVGRFELEPVEPEYFDGLVVYDAEGQRLGHIATGFLDAPAGLVLAVANAYREAARQEG